MGCVASKFKDDEDEEQDEKNLSNNSQEDIYYTYCCFLLIVIIYLNIYYYLYYEQVFSTYKNNNKKYQDNKKDRLIHIDHKTQNIIVDDLSKYEFQNTLKTDSEISITDDTSSISNISAISDISNISVISAISTKNNDYLLNINIYVDCDKYSISLLEKLITSYFQNDTNMTKNNTYIKLYGDWDNNNDKMFDNIFDCEFTNIYKYNKKNENNNTKMMLDLLEDACLGNTMKIYLITNDGSFSHVLEKIKNDYSHVELVLPWRPYISKKIKAYVNLHK